MEPALTDREKLIDAAANAAVEQLKRDGGFFPFAIVLLSSGEHEIYSAKPRYQPPDAVEMQADLTEILKSAAATGEILGAALALMGSYGIKGGQLSDAIVLLVDGAGWQASNFYIPYKKQFLLGYKLDQPRNQKAAPIFFGASWSKKHNG